MHYLILLAIIIGLIYGIGILLKLIFTAIFTFIVTYLWLITAIVLTVLAVVFYKKVLGKLDNYKHEIVYFKNDYELYNEDFELICKYRGK